jgi:TATA-box binding protein (TBP) (component of TFIID and TFIIIB)
VEFPYHDAQPLLKTEREMNSKQDWKFEVYKKIKIENVVCTCRLVDGKTGGPFNFGLQYLGSKLMTRGAKYNKKRIAATILRFIHPKIAVLIFAQGKMVVTGSKSEDQGTYTIYRTVKLLKTLGYKNIEVRNITVQNVVGNTALPFKLKIKRLGRDVEYCTQDSSLFPGAIIRYPPISPIAVLAFKPGKMVITGAKTEEGIVNAVKAVLPLLEKYADGKIQTNPISTQTPNTTPTPLPNQDVKVENSPKVQTPSNSRKDRNDEIRSSSTQIKRKQITSPDTMKKAKLTTTSNNKVPEIKEESNVKIENMPSLIGGWFFKNKQ